MDVWLFPEPLVMVMPFSESSSIETRPPYTNIFHLIHAGDPEFKKYVIPTPDVVEVSCDGTEEYMVLATDGLWDEVSPGTCHDLIKAHLLSTRKCSARLKKIKYSTHRRAFHLN